MSSSNPFQFNRPFRHDSCVGMSLEPVVVNNLYKFLSNLYETSELIAERIFDYSFNLFTLVDILVLKFKNYYS